MFPGYQIISLVSYLKRVYFSNDRFNLDAHNYDSPTLVPILKISEYSIPLNLQHDYLGTILIKTQILHFIQLTECENISLISSFPGCDIFCVQTKK